MTCDGTDRSMWDWSGRLMPSEVKVGDLVKKAGPMDAGEIGLVLSIQENEFKNKFLKILKVDGTIKVWYEAKVKIVNEGK